MREKQEGKGILAVKKIFGLLVFLVCLYFVLGELLLPPENSFGQYSCSSYGEGWSQVKADGSRIPIVIPGKYHAGRGELIAIENTLPDNLDSGLYLCFRSCKQETRIYVDGVLRQTYSTNDTRLFGKTSAVAYVFLKLEPEDAAKKILIETQTDSSYTGVFQECYYGERMGIWVHLFKKQGTDLLIAFFILVLGILSIILSVVLRRIYRKRIQMEYFGWCAFLAAAWLIVNSSFRQLLVPNTSVISDMAFFMLMLLPFSFLLFMNDVQNGRYSRFYVAAGILVILDFVLCTALHITSRIDFADTIVYMAVVCVLVILLMIITIFLDTWRGTVKEYASVAIGIVVLSMAAAVQILIYFKRTIPFNGSVIAVGSVFMLAISAFNSMKDILYMEKEKQQAVISNETKGKFLANMSHEIRTPINAILGMDQMILRECREPSIKEYAMDIRNAGQNLLSIVNDILDFSKIESGKMEIIPVKYDFSSVVHDVATMILAKIQSKNLAFHVTVDPSLPFCLYGDEVRIRQVLLNLLTNAVKYTDAGSVSLNVGGTVQGETVLLRFAVEDTGAGIKEEDIPKLFEEFERIDEKRNRHIEGTGLGMNITMQLLSMMGSRLEVKSTYGKGSVFSFELEQPIIDREPIGNLNERIQNLQTEYHYEAEYTASEARILVVDDNAVNRRVFMNLLKETEIQVEEAESGIECLEMIQKACYDIIFLDHMMPEMDGIETLRRMKEYGGLCKDTPVVALTANAVSGAREMYLSEGFDSFLSKPIIPEKLEKLIHGLLPPDKISYVHHEKTPDGDTGKADMPDFPVIDGIDWSYGWLHLPDEKLLMKTVADFYRGIDTEADSLETCWRNLEHEPDGMQAYRIRVHAMKSSAALIGAVPISGMAKILESAARDGKREIIEQMTPVFLEEWRGYKGKLKVCIRESEKKAIEDDSVILASLESLRVAMEDMDIDTADEKMAWLRQYGYPENLQIFIDELDAAVSGLNSEKVGQLTEKLISEIQGRGKC